MTTRASDGPDIGAGTRRHARRCGPGGAVKPAYRPMGTARNVTLTWPWPCCQPPPVTSRRCTGGGVKAGE